MRARLLALGILAALVLSAVAAGPRGAEVGGTGSPVAVAPVLAASAVLPVVVPLGDVDADGTSDVLVAHPGAAATTVLSGATGNALGGSEGWRQLSLDVTGDGRPDALRLTRTGLAVEESCDVLGRCDRVSRWSWQVAAAPAVGGAATWRSDIPAALVEEHNDAGPEGTVVRRERTWDGAADHVEVRVLPASSGHSGTVLVTTRSTQGVLQWPHGPGGFGAEPDLRTTATAASVLALGEDGRVAGSRGLEVGPGREEYRTVGDVDGDGRGDLALVEPRAGSGAVDVRLVGRELRPTWDLEVHVGSRLEPFGDRSGTQPRVATVDAGVVDVLDGRTGERVYRTEDVRVAAGRAGQGALGAVAYEVVDSSASDDDGTTRTMAVRLGDYDLATGSFAGFVEQHSLGEFASGSMPNSFAGFDVDGDGRLDLVGQEYVSGISGGRLLTLTRAGVAFAGAGGPLAVPTSAVELDGFPGTEVLWHTFSEADGDWTGVMASRPGQRMWQARRAWFDRLAAVVGSATTDWAEGFVAADGSPGVRLRDGVTLDVRWTARLGQGAGTVAARG